MRTLRGSRVFTTTASCVPSSAHADGARGAAIAAQTQTATLASRSMNAEWYGTGEKKPRRGGVFWTLGPSSGGQLSLTAARHEAHQAESGDQHRIGLGLGNRRHMEAAPRRVVIVEGRRRLGVQHHAHVVRRVATSEEIGRA